MSRANKAGARPDAWTAEGAYLTWRARRAWLPILALALGGYALFSLVLLQHLRGPVDFVNAVLATTSWQEWLEVVHPLLAAGAAIGIYWSYVIRVIRKQESMLDPETIPDPEGRLHNLTEQCVARAKSVTLARAEAEFFTGVAVEPERYFVRLSESLEQYTRSYKATAVYSVQMPRKVHKRDLALRPVIPLVWAWRGSLESGLHVTESATGRRLSTLPAIETAAYVVAVVYEYLNDSLSPSDRDKFWTGDGLGGKVAALALEGSKGSFAWSEAERQTHFFNLAASLAALTSRHVALVLALLTRLVDRYPICVRVPGGFDTVIGRDGPWRVTAERRVLAETEGSSPDKEGLSQVNRLYGWTKGLVGIRSNTIRYPLEQAGTARSYHLSAPGPDGTYMARQSLATIEPESVSIFPAHVAFAQARGQRHSHVYVSDGWDSGIAGVYYSASYFERPPTSVGRTFLVSLAGALVVAVAGKMQLHALATGQSSDTSGIAQVLLALPLGLLHG